MAISEAAITTVLSAKLTHKEAEVVSKIVERKANKEIAQDLQCSTKTIELHISNLFRKLGVKSRLELACKVLALLHV
ncbi:MAG: helix-turn-helix transcriptional regulator [Polyangiaceae bacterium]